jgi:hypothetical protein
MITNMDRFIAGYVCLTQEEMARKNITREDLTPGEFVVGFDDNFWLDPNWETAKRLAAQGVEFL